MLPLIKIRLFNDQNDFDFNPAKSLKYAEQYIALK